VRQFPSNFERFGQFNHFLAAIQPLTVMQSVNIGTEGAIAICAALGFAALTKLDLSVFILMDLFVIALIRNGQNCGISSATVIAPFLAKSSTLLELNLKVFSHVLWFKSGAADIDCVYCSKTHLLVARIRYSCHFL